MRVVNRIRVDRINKCAFQEFLHLFVPAEELGVGGADLASLLAGKRRRKRQLFGEDETAAQSLSAALSTATGLFGKSGARV